MNRNATCACPVKRGLTVFSLVVETQKRNGACALHLASSGSFLNASVGVNSKQLWIATTGCLHKSFRSWDHLVALIYAQSCGSSGLRGLEAGWNANSQHHYHLGSGPLMRSTLSDANRRRPVAVFAEAFGLVANLLVRQTRREGEAMLRLIDSTPFRSANCAIGPSRTGASAA